MQSLEVSGAVRLIYMYIYIYIYIYVVRHQRVKVDLKNVECEHVDWGYLVQNILWWSYVKELIKLRARKMAGDF